MRWGFAAAAALLVTIGAVMLASASVTPLKAEQASDWHLNPHTGARLRLIAGGSAAALGQPDKLLAGIQIELADGWKTYWRNPGDSGLPPEFDWTGGRNVAGAEVLYPAPQRFADPAGSMIGYKGAVTLPVLIARSDAAKPAALKVAAAIGVCSDICVPILAELSVAGVGPQSGEGVPEVIAAALSKVPGTVADGAAQPKIASVVSTFDGKTPHLALEIDFGAGAASGDIFMEGPRGLFIPMAERVGVPADGRVRFRVDLTQTDDAGDLKGKTVRVTMVSDAGQAEAEVALQ